MFIKISEEALDFELREAFRKMPITANTNPENKKHSSPVLHRIAYETKNNPMLCVLMYTFYKTIFRRLEARGIIIYDSETDTWRGVDYHGD